MYEDLFKHLDLITRQRDRVQLEVALVEAARELLGAGRARLHKLLTLHGRDMVGVVAETGPEGATVGEDGFGWPEAIGHLALYPHLQQAARGDACHADTAADTGEPRAVQPLRRDGAAYGLLEVIGGDPAGPAQRELLDGLERIMGNCLSLLDYSELDTLTGLLNRKTFDVFLMRILSRLHVPGDGPDGGDLPRRRQSQPEARDHWLAVVDIDHFKRVNDSFGHLIGDEVLLLLANMMKESFRAQDKLFRFGGEEFVVLLKPATAANARVVFDRFRRRIEGYAFPQVGRVTISIGFSRIGVGDSPTAVIDNADEALYWAKNHGRNRVAHYEVLIADGELQPRGPVASDVELF